MDLRTATLIVLVMTCVYMGLNLISFVTNFSFYFRSLDGRGAEAILNLLFRLSSFAWEGALIVFFAVLYSKQKQQ
jgi:hypothetical protein